VTLAAPQVLVGRRRALPRPAVGIPTAEILALRAKSIWRYLRAQDLAFLAMCFYLIVEYIRPQQLFSVIYGAPLGKIGLGLALVTYFGTGRLFKFRSSATLLFLVFTAVILASSAQAFDSSLSFQDVRDIWLPWMLIFFLIVSVIDTEQKFAVFLLLWLLCHYYMAQGGFKQFAFRGFRFAPWGITGQPGWFHNSGEFAIAMCMLTAVSWHFYQAAKPYLSKWRKVFTLGMPFTGVMTVIGSSSRGALLGLAAIGLWIVMRTERRVRTIGAVAVLAVLGWLVLPAEQKARFASAGEDETSVARLTYWKAGMQMARENPALGIGFGNWVLYYRVRFMDGARGKVQVSHNIFIQCVAELGYTGLFVFVALIIATLRINHQTRQLASAGPDPPNVFLIQTSIGLDAAMISYLVAGFFVTVLYYPFFWVNLAFTVALNGIAQARSAGRVTVPTATQQPAVRGSRNARFARAR
jgi:putative inorganic carbon (hco3(-)) transporter